MFHTKLSFPQYYTITTKRQASLFYAHLHFNKLLIQTNLLNLLQLSIMCLIPWIESFLHKSYRH